MTVKNRGVDSGACRLNNLEPEKWLRYVIEHIQDWPANRGYAICCPGKLN
ncbi:transposase domain-containing protein (plasmid) [Escherichia coli]|nr:transposase domain-containing protein [Escherichia coli]